MEPLLLQIAIVLAAAKLGGWMSKQIGQPAVLGELLAGLILGPSVINVFGINYFSEAHTTETIRELGEIGVIFLMFVAGLEIELSDFAKLGKPAFLAGTLGVIVPIALSMIFITPFGYDLTHSAFVGITLAATSVSISAQTLMELNLLRSREGLTLLGAAVVDDVLALVALSLFTALVGESGSGFLELVWITTRMILFLVISFFGGLWLLPRVVRWANRLSISQPVISIVIINIMIFAWAAQALGSVAAITGSFIAGVGLSRSEVKNEIVRGIHTLTYSFFVPIFLVGIGLTANMRALSSNDLAFAIVVIVIAIISKIVGCGLGAKVGGMAWGESLRVGVGMISRGEVGLIVASAGITSGIITNSLFTVVIVMVIVSTLVTPPLLRLVFSKSASQTIISKEESA
ncbi:MAG: cation:proton antiporter [Chloroflexi bacterium]|nr:cation:proton antiporter [Chloroflexota bacterium]MBI5714157.1 cation:proton antiporter [Chloroflexota bacterium]